MENLTTDQEYKIISFYDAQQNSTLDNVIKNNLREYKQSKTRLENIENDLSMENVLLNNAKDAIEKRIKKLEKKAKVNEASMFAAKENLIERHFELNGEIII